MEKDRRESFMRDEHEVADYLQVNVREYPRNHTDEPSESAYSFEPKVETGVRVNHNDPVRVPLDSSNDAWSDVPEDVKEHLEFLRVDDDCDRKCVYEVRDDGGGHDEYSDEKLVAIYAGRDEAEEHAEQIGGYVRVVSEAPEVCSTRKDTMHAELMWDWENDDLFEGIAYLEKKIENGEIGRDEVRGELFDLEDLVEEGKLDDTKDIRKRITILEYWYGNRAFDLLGEH